MRDVYRYEGELTTATLFGFVRQVRKGKFKVYQINDSIDPDRDFWDVAARFVNGPESAPAGFRGPVFQYAPAPPGYLPFGAVFRALLGVTFRQSLVSGNSFGESEVGVLRSFTAHQFARRLMSGEVIGGAIRDGAFAEFPSTIWWGDHAMDWCSIGCASEQYGLVPSRIILRSPKIAETLKKSRAKQATPGRPNLVTYAVEIYFNIAPPGGHDASDYRTAGTWESWLSDVVEQGGPMIEVDTFSAAVKKDPRWNAKN